MAKKVILNKELPKNKVVKTNVPVYREKFKWGIRNDIIDWEWENKEFAFCVKDIPQFIKKIKPKLDAFSCNNWSQVENMRGNHTWDVNDLSNKALVTRYISKFKNNNEYETLYQLRLGSGYRLYGIRIDSTFYVLWKDPYHNAYDMNIADN